VENFSLSGRTLFQASLDLRHRILLPTSSVAKAAIIFDMAIYPDLFVFYLEAEIAPVSVKKSRRAGLGYL